MREFGKTWISDYLQAHALSFDLDDMQTILTELDRREQEEDALAEPIDENCAPAWFLFGLQSRSPGGRFKTWQ